MSNMIGHVRSLGSAQALCALALLLAFAAPALAASAPAWELISRQTPTEIPLTGPVNEVDTVTVGGVGAVPNVGHFSLEVDSEAGERAKTQPLRDTASAAAVQAALEALDTVGRGNVTVTGGPPREGGKGQEVWLYDVTFFGALAGRQVQLKSEEIEATEAEEEPIEKAGEKPEEGYVEVAVTTRAQRDTVKYELVASNTGGSPTGGTITVTDTLPAGLSTKTTPGGAGWTCAPPGEAQTTVTCTTEAVVEPGAKTAPITIEAYVDVSMIQAGKRVINTATISGGGALAPAEAVDPATTVRVSAPSGSSAGKAGSRGHRKRRVSSARIAALLARQLTPSGKTATIAALLRHGGFTIRFKALEAGTATVDWYQRPSGARPAEPSEPVLVGAGRLRFSAARTAKIRIELTRAGRRLLEQAKRLELTASGRFAPSGSAPVNVTRRFSLEL